MFTHGARVDSLIKDGWHYDAAEELANTGFYHAPIPVLNLYHRIVCCSCNYDVERPDDANAAIEMHFYYGKESCQWKFEATQEYQRVQGMEMQIQRQTQELLAAEVQQAEEQIQRNLALEESRLRHEQRNEQHRELAEQVSEQNTTKKPFACRRCPSKFTSNSKLHHHIKAHHSKSSRDPAAPPKINPGAIRTIFTCRRCSATFPSNTKLHIHLKEHHTKPPIQSESVSEILLMASSTAPSSEPSPFAASFSAAQRVPLVSEPRYMDIVQATPPTSSLPTPSVPSKLSSAATSPAPPTLSLNGLSIAETPTPAPPPIPWHTKPKVGNIPEA